MLCRGVIADFAVFAFDGPLVHLCGSLLQPPDFFQMFFVFGLLELVTALFILPPGGKVSALDFDALPVQDQDVVNAGVQKVPVVGDQEEAVLGGQILFHVFPGILVQVVCGFVDEQEIIFTGKQDGQHDFGLFSRA